MCKEGQCVALWQEGVSLYTGGMERLKYSKMGWNKKEKKRNFKKEDKNSSRGKYYKKRWDPFTKFGLTLHIMKIIGNL